jgi:hypothetical protein
MVNLYTMKAPIAIVAAAILLGGLPAQRVVLSTIFLAGFACLHHGCKETPPEPPDDTPKPGKCDYVWTVDTLAYPGSFQTLMRDI